MQNPCPAQFAGSDRGFASDFSPWNPLQLYGKLMNSGNLVSPNLPTAATAATTAVAALGFRFGNRCSRVGLDYVGFFFLSLLFERYLVPMAWNGIFHWGILVLKALWVTLGRLERF